MKKIIMLLTAIIPAVGLSILATIFLPVIFGESIKGAIPIIMIAVAIVTILITVLVGIKKRKANK